MRKEDKKKLTINRRIIVNHLTDIEGILDYLISKQIFTPSIRGKIIYENKGPSDQIRQTLDCLITKNALSYQYFLEALVLTDNSHIVNTLEPDYLASETCRLMIERERIVLPSPTSNQLLSPLNSHHANLNVPQQSNTGHLSKNLSFPIACGQNQLPQDLAFNSPNHFCNLSPQLTPVQIRQNNLQLQLSMHLQNQIQRSIFSSNFGSSTGNSRSSSQSQSMSPITNRARSSSVNGFCNLGDSNSKQTRKLNQTKQRNCSGVASNLIDQDCSYPVPVSNYDDNDQSSPGVLYNNGMSTEQPSTYNIDWSDVNKLDLDFVVYKTLPNIRKLSSDECYTMEKNPRGLCLIINNEHFYDENNKEIMNMRRYGTEMDASRLRNLFEKLNFQVETCVDQTEREMRQKITSFANECDMNSSAYDAICLILLSHGTDGYVYGVDFENRINLDNDILSLFDDILIGKPKLFIFQACRGEYLNQKDLIQNPVSFMTQSNSTSCLKTASLQTGKPPKPITPASSCSSMDDDTIKKFKGLKVSSQQPGSLQLMYKKKISTNSSSSNASSSTSLISKSSGKMKTRSRSHSRSKYAAYLTTAATAIKTKMSPNSSRSNLASISTQTNSQTSSSQSLTSSHEEPVTANCYPNTNIITSTTYNQSLMNFIDGRPIKTCLPSRSDFFIWYSSARGYVSHRDADGSPFIKCLVTVFSRSAYELELIEMVRKVNLLMQQYEKRHFDERNAVASYFMVPVAEFHLAKKLYFNP